MTNRELSEIEERAKKASRGPWMKNGKTAGVWRIDDCDPERSGIVFLMNPTALVPNDDNATFIAEAREDVPALVAALVAERALADRLAKVLGGAPANAIIHGCDEALEAHEAARKA